MIDLKDIDAMVAKAQAFIASLPDGLPENDGRLHLVPHITLLCDAIKLMKGSRRLPHDAAFREYCDQQLLLLREQIYGFLMLAGRYSDAHETGRARKRSKETGKTGGETGGKRGGLNYQPPSKKPANADLRKKLDDYLEETGDRRTARANLVAELQSLYGVSAQTARSWLREASI